MPLWQILLISFGCALFAALPMYFWLRTKGAQAKQRIYEMAAGRVPTRQGQARTFGIRSRGRTQARGNGGLFLFDDELIFVQLVGGTDVRIPRDKIVGIQTPRGFLGKTTGAKLLEVTWKTEHGTDAAAFQLPDLDGWIAELGGERKDASAG